MWVRWLFSSALLFAIGCGEGRLAPVSGKVTLNGQPLVGATVGFEPLVERQGIEAPLSSTGKTNDKGEYTLETLKGQKGALVGLHKVAISLLQAQVGEGDARPPRSGWPVKDKVPARYNAKSELKIDVPAGGTDKADFDLKAP